MYHVVQDYSASVLEGQWHKLCSNLNQTYLVWLGLNLNTAGNSGTEAEKPRCSVTLIPAIVNFF